MSINNAQADMYADFNGLANLRLKATQDKDSAIDEVARQFETIFMKMMLKSMRDSVSESSLINTDKQKFYQSMYDDQIALNMSQGDGLGLREMITMQLGGDKIKNSSNAGDTVDKYLASRIRAVTQPVSQSISKQAVQEKNLSTPSDFVKQLWGHAKQAAEKLGVDSRVLLAQSALETGWGKHVMHSNTGENSHNLFGIKASSSWQGKTVSVQTIEYEEGVAVKRQASFRAYDSYQDSFNDYVKFLKENPRYQQALEQVDSNENFIKGLQKAGYATDPAYAKKIISILGRENIPLFDQSLQKESIVPIKS